MQLHCFLLLTLSSSKFCTVFNLNHNCFFKNSTHDLLAFTWFFYLISGFCWAPKLCLHKMILQYSAFTVILLFHVPLCDHYQWKNYQCQISCSFFSCLRCFCKQINPLRMHFQLDVKGSFKSSTFHPWQVSVPEYHCNSSSASPLSLNFIEWQEGRACRDAGLAGIIIFYFLFLAL